MADTTGDRETLRRDLAETLRSWAAADTSDILGDDYDPADKRCLCHNAEGAADALLSGPLADVLDCTHPEGWETDLAERLEAERDALRAEVEQLAAARARVRALCETGMSRWTRTVTWPSTRAIVYVPVEEVFAALDTPEGETGGPDNEPGHGYWEVGDY